MQRALTLGIRVGRLIGSSKGVGVEVSLACVECLKEGLTLGACKRGLCWGVSCASWLS